MEADLGPHEWISTRLECEAEATGHMWVTHMTTERQMFSNRNKNGKQRDEWSPVRQLAQTFAGLIYFKIISSPSMLNSTIRPNHGSSLLCVSETGSQVAHVGTDIDLWLSY